jgi:type I restriction-modification system DNA methylase subunit/DNA replication protein DnaC
MFPNEASPYPGPVSFNQSQQNIFFGREVAIRKLVSLIRSQSIILLYGKSGTGKTSLLNAGIIPALKIASDPNAELLGVIRFQGKPAMLTYIDSLLQQLNSLTGNKHSSTTLLKWFEVNQTQSEELQHRVLIFDQFEEFFTVSPEAWEEREQFFDQLDELIRQHRNVRVLLVIREDFLGDLFRYASRLSTGIDVRFQLLMLKSDEARQAIERPVEYSTDSRIRYAPEATDAIITALRTEQARSDESSESKTYITEFVSPLLLQLVCSDLWEQLPPQITTITQEDVQRVDVNTTVTNFYRSRVEQIASEHKLQASDLYSWFEKELIFGEKRIPVFVREDLVGSLPIELVRAIENEHLISRETYSAGADFYELAHDRFVWAVQQVANERLASRQSDTSQPVELVSSPDLEPAELEETYRTPDEQVAASGIWKELGRLVSRGRLTSVDAIVVAGEALNLISRSLDQFSTKGAELISFAWLSEWRSSINLTPDDWQRVQNAIASGVTQYSTASIQDIFYWLLNEAARSRPQSFNDIFTPFTVGQLMISLLGPGRGDLYDPFCHSGEIFGYFKREILSESGDASNYVLAVDRYVESRDVTKVLLKIANLDTRAEVTIEDALTTRHDIAGRFDYVFTNPPFNDKNVDWLPISPSLKPFGDSTNSNIAWVQHIYAALKPTGRAAFLMVSSLAKSNEQILRELVRVGAVETIVDLGQDRLYRGVATHMWFLNRAMEGQDAPILFIDMTEVGVQRRPRLFTDEHIERASRIMATFRESVRDEIADESFLLDQPGFCRAKQRSELLNAEVLDLAPKTHVISLPRTEPTRNIRDLIREYEVLRTEAVHLDARVADVLSRISNRLQS